MIDNYWPCDYKWLGALKHQGICENKACSTDIYNVFFFRLLLMLITLILQTHINGLVPEWRSSIVMQWSCVSFAWSHWNIGYRLDCWRILFDKVTQKVTLSILFQPQIVLIVTYKINWRYQRKYMFITMLGTCWMPDSPALDASAYMGW